MVKCLTKVVIDQLAEEQYVIFKAHRLQEEAKAEDFSGEEQPRKIEDAISKKGSRKNDLLSFRGKKKAMKLPDDPR